MPGKILHILGTAQPHGTSIARIIGQLACGLNCKRYRVHAWFLGDDGPLTEELQKSGVRVRVVKWGGGWRDPIGAWRFWRALCDEEFSIIHQLFGGRSVRWLARRVGRARIIVHVHGRVSELDGATLLPIVIQDADAVIANSNAVARQVVGLQPYVVHPGVRMKDDDSHNSAASRKRTGNVVGTACRLVPIKGVGYLIRALALLREEIPDVRLEIAGSGLERIALEREVKLLGMDDHVRFLGWQADLTSVLARWDVFALPSLEEGFGVAALEAMAVGLPVVASAVGGIPELIVDGRTGYLVPPGDARALAECLRRLLLNPAQQRTLGDAGLARARQHFSSEGMVETISKIYDSLLEPSTVGHAVNKEGMS